MVNKIGQQAIIIGAGMGGLCVAKALAASFDQVLVLENDALSKDGPADRPGTPQAKHAHAMLAGGQMALATLFPDIEAELGRAGAVSMHLGTDLRIDRPGFDPFPQMDAGMDIYSMSRALIEYVVRAQVLPCSNVTIRERTHVHEFLVSADGGTVTGVRCGPEGQTEELKADLVVDCSSHGLLTLKLLESLHQPPPPETTIGLDIGYSTAIFDIPSGAPQDWKGTITYPDLPHNRRGAFLLPLENQQWIVTLSGRYEEKPPTDEAGFLDHAQKLLTPTVYQAIKNAKRHGDIVPYHLKATRGRHFNRLSRFPRHLLPFGDTICRINPFYGQGISITAQEACMLQRLLVSGVGLEGLVDRFFAEAEAIIHGPWMIAAVSDFRDPRTEGQRPPNLEQAMKFSAAFFKVAAEDPAIYKTLLEVQHLVKPQSACSTTDILQKVRAVLLEG